MQVCSIQKNTFQGVYTPLNFNPTDVQKRMIKTVKHKLKTDGSVFRKGKNFHNFLESKGDHFLLSSGDYKDELKIELGFFKKNGNFVPCYNLGSYPENRLDNIVQELKDKRRELVAAENLGMATMALLGLGIIAMAILDTRH